MLCCVVSSSNKKAVVKSADISEDMQSFAIEKAQVVLLSSSFEFSQSRTCCVAIADVFLVAALALGSVE
jgi:hypothetical protein